MTVIAIDVAGRPIERVIGSWAAARAHAAVAAELMALAVVVIGTAAMLFGARQLAMRLAEHRPPIGSANVQQWETGVMVELLQLAIMVCAGLLLLAVLQPFLHIREGVTVVVLMASAVALVVWRSARRLAAGEP